MSSGKIGGSSPASPQLRTALLALLAGVVMSGCGFLIDVLVHKANRLMASDIYTFALAFLFSYALLRHEARRRAVLSRRMEIAAEVNHHIRNALTGIVYTAAVRSDPALQAVLEDATARIDWVLTTVMPDGANELRWPVQVPSWRPLPWEDRREHREHSSGRTATREVFKPATSLPEE